MSTLFVSDVHLSTARPHIVEAFLRFLDGPARRAQALYILGDCFDLYLGDDDITEPHPTVIAGLKSLSCDTQIYFQQGNHDFLTGAEFARLSGCTLLEDFAVTPVNGHRVLLTHGDLFCTDDTDYQSFREYTRRAEVQSAFLALPLEQRKAQADNIRQAAQAKSRLKPCDIMDVNEHSVLETMKAHDVRFLIHGHTHRPNIHEHTIGGDTAVRIVLGDWYEQDSVLLWEGDRYAHVRINDLC